MVNQDEFAREVTIRICSSLEIKESLRAVYDYLRMHLPLDELFLILLDPSLNAVRRIAYAGRDEIDAPDEIVPIPEQALKEFSTRQFTEPFIMTAEDDDSVVRAMATQYKLEGKTDLIVPLHASINGDMVGALNLRVWGKGRYTEQHTELMRSVEKPFAIALTNALAHEAVVRYRDILLDDNRFLNRELYAHSGEEIVGANSGLRNIMEMVHQVASLNNTVLLLGETGTGKEVIANAIHFSSPRKDKPFIKVNCGAIPENLIDSELFGYERGAFTGAVKQYRGRFERADGGTIFLDEIGELPLVAQVRLLRVLQDREVERVGGKQSIPVDIRVIAATHRNLQNMIGEGRFREDLWYRLNGFPIMVPPVRQRKEDVPALIRYFIAVKSKELGLGVPPPVAGGALVRLMDYNWPGNVRELENMVERELIRHREGPLMFAAVQPGDESAHEAVPAAISDVPTDLPLKLEEVVSIHLGKVLKMTNGKIYGPGGAADILGMNPNTLRWRLDKLGIRYRRREREEKR